MNAIIFTAVFGVVLLFGGLWIKNPRIHQYIAIAGILITLVLNIGDNGVYAHAGINTMIHFDSFSRLFNTVILFSTLLYFLLSGSEYEKVGEYVAEYFSLIFFILCGIMVATCFTNMLLLFLAIEIISIPQYILAGSDKKNLKSNEASLKYFLMGAFSTGILLMGITLIYGATGTFDIMALHLAGSGIQPLVLVGMVLIIFALSFKVSAAPFHFWAPDVYDGAPTVVTSFMATVVKAGVFVAFIRLFSSAFSGPNIRDSWTLVLAIITAATLLIGNFTAVFQYSVKRMLAYSSIAQAGFMLFAVIALNQLALQGILLYAAAYSLATIGAFGVLMKLKDYTYDGFNGLAKKQPLLAFASLVFFLSLTGIPATAGFMAKYFVLSAAIQQGQLVWLVILAVCCAAISAYYYFRVIIAMYFKSGDPELTSISRGFKVMLVVFILLILTIGVYPGLILNWF
ncbi:MAG: NADH-quinone oxidoreductase subunit N [Chitinophagaceae bacterium]